MSELSSPRAGSVMLPSPCSHLGIETGSNSSSVSDQLEYPVYTPSASQSPPSSADGMPALVQTPHNEANLNMATNLDSLNGSTEHVIRSGIARSPRGGNISTDSLNSWEVVSALPDEKNHASPKGKQPQSPDSRGQSPAAPDQIADEFTLPSRRPSDPPTARDWNDHRGIFTNLYRHESRTLKDVRLIMEERYGFKASERMYKKRISDWKLRKYNARGKERSSSNTSREKKSKSPTNQEKQASTLHLSSGENAPVGSSNNLSALSRSRHSSLLKQDLDRYLRATHPNLSYDRFMAISRDLQNFEIILSQVHSYYDSYSQSTWERTFPKTSRASIKELPLCSDMQMVSETAVTPMVRHPGELFNRFHMATELLKMKTPEANELAWKMLGEAFGMVKDVLLQQHPQLMRYFFMQFWDHTIDEYPEIRRSLFVSTHDLANVYLGPNHPITLISHLLPRMENKSSVCEVAWRRQLDTFESILGVANDESLRLKMSLTGNYVVAGQYDEAETLLWQIVSIFDPDSTAYYHRAALCRIAWIQSLRLQYLDAEIGFTNVLRLCQAQTSHEVQAPVDDIYLAATTHLARIQARRDYTQGLQVLEGALERCKSSVGHDHAYTYTIKNELVKLSETAKTNALLDDLVVAASPKT